MSDTEREPDQPQQPDKPFDEESEEQREAEAPWGTEAQPHEGEEGQEIA